jgi:hypothetical protein
VPIRFRTSNTSLRIALASMPARSVAPCAVITTVGVAASVGRASACYRTWLDDGPGPFVVRAG